MVNDEEHDVSYESDVDQINTLFRKTKDNEPQMQEVATEQYTDKFAVKYDGENHNEFAYAVGIHKRGDERTQQVKTMATTQKKTSTTKKTTSKKSSPQRRTFSKRRDAKKNGTRSIKPVGTRVKKKSHFWLWLLLSLIVICILALLFLFVTAPKDGGFLSGLKGFFGSETTNDPVLAKVNGEAITQSQYDSYYKKLPVALRAEMDEEKVLNQVIDKTLLLQFAQQKGIDASQADIDGMIEELLMATGLNEADLEAYLLSQNMTLEEYRELVKEDIILSKIVNEHIIQNIVITPEQAMAYYALSSEVLGNLSFEEANESIVEFLRIQEGRVQFEALMKELHDNAVIEIMGTTPQEPVNDIEEIKQEITDKYVEKTNEEMLADCLAEKGVKYYTAHWCMQCQSQLEDFGDAASKLTIVECFEPDNKKDVAQECVDADIVAYPTWKSADVAISGRQSLVKLSRTFGCV